MFNIVNLYINFQLYPIKLRLYLAQSISCLFIILLLQSFAFCPIQVCIIPESSENDRSILPHINDSFFTHEGFFSFLCLCDLKRDHIEPADTVGASVIGRYDMYPILPTYIHARIYMMYPQLIDSIRDPYIQ